MAICYNWPVVQQKVSRGSSKQDPKKADYGDALYQSNLFLVLALNMTWQLVIVVLVPIVVGHFVDEHFGLMPLFTIVGAVLAAAGSLLVLWRIVKLATIRAKSAKGKK